MVELEKVLPLD